MKEIITYYDETGKVNGTIDKDIAHKEGLWHKSVHVWIVNDKKQILLQKRAPNKDIYPNVWDVSFAGHVSAGEESLTSVIREGKEELGIDIDLDNLVYLFTNKESLAYKDVVSNEFVDVYLLKQNINIKDISIQEEELSEVKYIDIKDFFKMNDSLFPHQVEYDRLKEII